MKKTLSFLRSMRFGMILLVAVILLSLVGSIIPQGNSVAWYAQNYASSHHLILGLGLNRLFSTWYFLALIAALCLNLLACSLVRIGHVKKQAAAQLETAAAAENQYAPSAEGLEKLRKYLDGAHFKRTETDSSVIYHKNRTGFYGSFLTHLSILLVFVVGAAVLRFSQTNDYTVMPGETLTLSDGTHLTVNTFRIENAEGDLDFTSSVTVTAPDGAVSGPVDISVNYPHSFRSNKYYQQTYGTCGSVTVTDTESGGEDVFTLDEVSFLTADGVNGVWYEALYPGYLRDEEGNFTLITSTSGAYADPVYQVLVCADGENTPVLAFPGEVITIGNLQYTFNDPVSYPGIRVKTTPQAALYALYAVFVLMLAGLWLCFFCTPAAVTVRCDGYALSGRKLTGLELELTALLGEDNTPANVQTEEE